MRHYGLIAVLAAGLATASGSWSRYLFTLSCAIFKQLAALTGHIAAATHGTGGRGLRKYVAPCIFGLIAAASCFLCARGQKKDRTEKAAIVLHNRQIEEIRCAESEFRRVASERQTSVLQVFDAHGRLMPRRILDYDQQYTTMDLTHLEELRTASSCYPCGEQRLSYKVMHQDERIQEVKRRVEHHHQLWRDLQARLVEMVAQINKTRDGDATEELQRVDSKASVSEDVSTMVSQRDASRVEFVRQFKELEVLARLPLESRLGFLKQQLGQLQSNLLIVRRNHGERMQQSLLESEPSPEMAEFEAPAGLQVLRRLPHFEHEPARESESHEDVVGHSIVSANFVGTDIEMDLHATLGALRCWADGERAATMISTTDNALCELGDTVKARLTDGQYFNSIALEASVMEALNRIAEEDRFWSSHSHPMDCFPFDAVQRTLTNLIGSFEREEQETRRFLDAMSDTALEVKAIEANPKPKNSVILRQCEDDLKSQVDHIANAKARYQEFQNKVSFRRMTISPKAPPGTGGTTSEEAELETQLYDEAKKLLHAAVLEFNQERDRLRTLTTKYFPELELQYPEVHDLRTDADREEYINSLVTSDVASLAKIREQLRVEKAEKAEKAEEAEELKRQQEAVTRLHEAQLQAQKDNWAAERRSQEEKDARQQAELDRQRRKCIICLNDELQCSVGIA
jgi:hypothetical protein